MSNIPAIASLQQHYSNEDGIAELLRRLRSVKGQCLRSFAVEYNKQTLIFTQHGNGTGSVSLPRSESDIASYDLKTMSSTQELRALLQNSTC